MFSPKDDNLGELMSTVCGCTCEGGQVWVHARRRGWATGRTRPAGGSESMRVVQERTPSKPVKLSILLRRTRCPPSFCPLMPAGPRKPVERHNGRIYRLTRDVALGLARLCPPGRILGTQRIPRGRDPDGGDVDENGCFTY